MKTGIYISGLGQSAQNEAVEEYAERLRNELSFASTGISYALKTEKITYSRNRESTVVSIFEKKEGGRILYKFYDFKYHKILTEKFNGYSLLLKNVWLFLLVLKKAPMLIRRIFNPASYNRPYQTLYLFSIFLLISFAIIIMLPATLTVILSISDHLDGNGVIQQIKSLLHIENIPWITKAGFEDFSKFIVSFTALLLIFLPNANVMVTALATEFVCVNDYMEHGMQKQMVQGNLELLIDFITENDSDAEIHFHAYSFGSILALDYLYPFGNKVSKNAELYCKALITIGTPFEFVNSYYPKFFKNRNLSFGDQLPWLNIYSIADALATNFRQDAEIGEAEFGVETGSKKPANINYEVVPLDKIGIADFFMLYSLKAHGMYWDADTEGQSCMRLLCEEMRKYNLITT